MNKKINTIWYTVLTLTLTLTLTRAREMLTKEQYLWPDGFKET